MFNVGDYVIAKDDRYLVFNSKTPCKVVSLNVLEYYNNDYFMTNGCDDNYFMVENVISGVVCALLKNRFRKLNKEEIEQVITGEWKDIRGYVICGVCKCLSSRDEIRTTTDNVNLCPHCWRDMSNCCDHCGDMYWYGSKGKYNAYGDWYCNKCVQDGYYSRKKKRENKEE